jgi:hypothetical protein
MGEQLISEHGITRVSIGSASTEHEYWRNELHKKCTEHGYTVTTEYNLGNNRVDLHATRADATFLIEIETGKSDVLRNIEKCNGKGTLILFFTNTNALETMKDHIPANVIALTPNNRSQLDTILR